MMRIKGWIFNGFKELYQTQHAASVSTEDIDINWTAALSKEEYCKLLAMPSALEIHKALFSLKPYKAPRNGRVACPIFSAFLAHPLTISH